MWTYVMNTTSHFPWFRPDSWSFSKSMTFCSSLSFPLTMCSDGVRRRPYSPTRVKWGEASRFCRTWRPAWPVAPITSALFPGIGEFLDVCLTKKRGFRWLDNSPDIFEARRLCRECQQRVINWSDVQIHAKPKEGKGSASIFEIFQGAPPPPFSQFDIQLFKTYLQKGLPQLKKKWMNESVQKAREAGRVNRICIFTTLPFNFPCVLNEILNPPPRPRGVILQSRQIFSL